MATVLVGYTASRDTIACRSVMLGPWSVLAAEIEAGRLIRVLADYDGPARPMHVLYPVGRRPTVKVRSFVDALMAEFGPTR